MKLPNCPLAFLIISSFLFAQTNADFSTGANQAIRCMLVHESPLDCASVPKVIVPSYLLQVYSDSPPSLHEALRKKTLAQLSEEQISNIPLNLLYLIPRARLAGLSSNQLRAILQKYPDDTSLAHQVAACFYSYNNISQFIGKDSKIYLSEDTIQILAQSIETTYFTEDFLRLPFLEKEPLMAYLRPDVLFRLNTSTLSSIFLLLQTTESTKPPKKSAFYFLTEAAIRNRAYLSKLNGLVMGSSPDNLLNESLAYDFTVAHFRLDLSLLQARALFERLYQNISLTSSNFIDAKSLLFKLSPELLQRFPQNVHKYEVDYTKQTASVPLPSACQITEYIKAACIMTGRLPKNEEDFWDRHIRNLGMWVYTLPLSALDGYKTKILSTADLLALDSPAISPIQAYYLTGKGEALDVMIQNSILELETFLQALPASQLVNRKLGEISSRVLLHLVSKLPANNLARTLSLVNKIASSIGDTVDITGDSPVLKELLENRDVNQITSLISPKDLDLSAEGILKYFAENATRTLFRQTIEQLPPQILAALLEHIKLQHPSKVAGEHWSWSSVLDSSHVSHLLVGGLTCQHVEAMDTGLFIPIMARYNAVRKKIFPKNLQHCCLQKLMSLLKLKMTLTQADSDMGLISLLEPIEIESVGGYVLVNLPLDAMKLSPYLRNILSNIGQLSNAELMLSANVSQLQLIAQLAVDKDKNVNTFLVRNLVWFLPSNANTPDLRVMLEAGLLDTTICLPADARRDIATRLIAQFGRSEQWSAGVLAAMQDLLIVFNDEELSKVSRAAWTKAADSFTSHYDDSVDWIETSAFYKVCANILGKSEEIEYKNSIGQYIRWRLKAAQWLLDTVVPISQPKTDILDIFHHGNMLGQDGESNTPISIFNPFKKEDTTEEPYESEMEDSEYDEVKSEESVSTKEYNETSTVENKTDEISVEKSTTEETTSQDRTTEETNMNTTEYKKTSKVENRTDKSLVEKSTTEETTSQDRTTEDINVNTREYKKTSKVENNTDEILVEKSTTEETTSQDRTTEKTISEIRTTSGIFNKPKTDENVTEKNVSREKVTTNQSTLENNVTYSSSHGNYMTEQTFEEISRNITTEIPTTRSNVSVLISTSQKPASLIKTVTNIENNHTSQEQNSTEREFFSTITSTELSVNKGNLATLSVLNDTTSLSTKDVSDYSNFKNIQLQYQTTEKYRGEFDKSEIPTDIHSENQQSLEEIPDNSLPPQIKNNEIPPAMSNSKSNFSSNKINTTNIQGSEKKNTSDEISPPKTVNNINDTATEKHWSPSEVSSSGEFEEENLNGDIYQEEKGILESSTRRFARSIFKSESSDLELSCNAIKMVGSLAELALTISDLEGMSVDEIEDCRTEFGAMELSETLQKKIWNRLSNNLKLEGIHLLGRLLRMASVADLWDIKFYASEPWTLETIHAFIQYNNNTMVMKKLIEKVKRNAELSVDLLAVLGHTVCSLEEDNLKALSVIGLDLGPSCPPCLPYLAMRAIQELGGVDSWTLHFVYSLQAIVAGLDLDNWKELVASYQKPLYGLQPSAAKCLNISHLEILSLDQIRMIPAVTLLSLSEHQLAALNSTQLEAIRNITHPRVMEKLTPTEQIYKAGLPFEPNGNPAQVVPTGLLLVFISALHFSKYL